MQDVYTIDPLRRRLLGTKKTDEEEVNGNMVGIKYDTKEIEEKGRVYP